MATIPRDWDTLGRIETTTLWFKNCDDEQPARFGRMLYVANPAGVRAVLQMERTFPGDLHQEAAEMLGFFGGNVSGLGNLLAGEGVQLPPALHRWATAPDVPSAELGGWRPTLLSVDGLAVLALAREFGSGPGCTAYATVANDDYLTVLTPASDAPVELVRRSDLDGRSVAY